MITAALLDQVAASLLGDHPVEALREDTGELVTAAGLDLQSLQAYVDARRLAPALQLRLNERIEDLAREYMDIACLLDEIACYRRVIETTETQLAGAFTAAERAGGTLRLKLAGWLDVTWPRPALRWTQKVKPERIAARDPELAKRLGIEQATSAPAKPIIKIAEPSGVAAGGVGAVRPTTAERPSADDGELDRALIAYAAAAEVGREMSEASPTDGYAREW